MFKFNANVTTLSEPSAPSSHYSLGEGMDFFSLVSYKKGLLLTDGMSSNPLFWEEYSSFIWL